MATEPEPAIAMAIAPGAAPIQAALFVPGPIAPAFAPAPAHRGPASAIVMTATQTTSPAPQPFQHMHRARRLTNGLARMSESESMPRGWLRVGGPDYLGGKVLIDGVPLGFAPLEHPLPVGMHSLTIISPGSGQVLVRRVIRVGSHHTRVRPLTLLR
jgi:hypothetical protein